MAHDKSKAVNEFYHILDTDVAESLNDSQRREIEHTLDSMGLVTKHCVDVRKTFPWFGKRYYFVFFAGRDRRRLVRCDQLTLVNILLIAFLTALALATVILALLALYLIKSALGIDIFKHFSLGIWDWFQGLFLTV